jgi:hypothetical protein
MTPPGRTPIATGNQFSFPNRSQAQRTAIRNRVINTVNATWGRWYVPRRESVVPGCGHTITGWTVKRGTIKAATWSFNDAGVRDALVRAAQRGVSVQIVAARGVNRRENYRAWSSLRRYLRNNPGDRYLRGTANRNWAWECSGACRGRGGAPHSKYILFSDVRSSGNAHIPNITVQTSMNLTRFAWTGQWNSAVALRGNTAVYNRFLQIFRESAHKRVRGYQSTRDGGVINSFYPGGSSSKDPILGALNRVRCTGSTISGSRGRTRVRVIQYAIYDTRGNAIARKLRRLWNAGCDVRVIYSVSSRPVLGILRSRSGRGRIPVRQSVIKNRRGDVVKYNHSKWLAIAGHYSGHSRGTWTVVNGSANWSDFAYRSDETMQQYFGHVWAGSYFRNFRTTWRQKSSKVPNVGRVSAGGRLLPEQPTFGRGIYRYMTEGG